MASATITSRPCICFVDVMWVERAFAYSSIFCRRKNHFKRGCEQKNELMRSCQYRASELKIDSIRLLIFFGSSGCVQGCKESYILQEEAVLVAEMC